MSKYLRDAKRAEKAYKKHRNKESHGAVQLAMRAARNRELHALEQMGGSQAAIRYLGGVRRLQHKIALAQTVLASLDTYHVGQLGATLGIKPTTPCETLPSGAERIKARKAALGKRPKGGYICHRCDNPPCCRGDHMFWGTAQDNSRDCAIKGRGRRIHPKGQTQDTLTYEEWKERKRLRCERVIAEARAELARLVSAIG